MRAVILLACAVLGWPIGAGAVEAGAAGAGAREAGPVGADQASGAASPAGPAPAVPQGDLAHDGLPKVLSGAVKALEAECRAEGGVASWTAKGIFYEVNLSPDGRPDYVLDTHGITCSGGFTPWVGSDGFRYLIFVSTGPGRWTRAFERPARGLEIKDGPTPELILFSHSAYCSKPNPERYQRCTQVYVWRGGKLRKSSEEWFTD